METKYPTLRRPKRKLCYLTDKESPSKQWEGTLTLGDVDKMFDDLDPSSHDDGDIPSPSPLLQTFDIETNRSERESRPVPQETHLTEKPRCQVVMKQSVVTVTSTDNNKGPEGDVPDTATRSSSPKLEIDLDVPFKAHGPVKTSSPIEEDIVVEGVEELDNEKGSIVSPILFPCDDEGKEEAKTEPSPTQTPQCNGLAAENDVSEFESPPSKIALSAPKMSIQKNKGEGSCNNNHPVKENAPTKPRTPVLDGKRKAPSQENTDPSVSAVRQEPEAAALKKKPESVHRQPSLEVSTRVGKDMTTFLQKLRDAGKPNPARKSLSPVKVPTPPEPEDDFLILEDDAPLWFSIPSKTASTKRRSIASSTDKDSSTDKGSKDNVLETAQQQESEQENDKPRSQTVNQKTKRRKGKEKKNEVTEPGNDLHELSSPEDLPAGDLMEEKPDKKKRRLKKAPSKESDMEEEQPKDTASSQTDEERPTLKMEKKAQKSSEMKRSKSSKDGNKKDKTSRATSSKEARELTDAEDLVSLSDKEIVNSEAQTDEKEQSKLPIVSEESSSDNSQILGKRKRRPTGNWWLSCRQSAEETKVTDNLPTVKKSKQNNKEPSAAAAAPPVKTKKDRVLKQKNQTPPASSSSQNTNKGKEKKTRRNRNRNTRGDKPDKMKASEEAFDVLETEQIDEQQPEVPDQDLDPVQSSPLVHKDHSLNSGDQVFQRVYHHVSNKKMPITPPPASPRRPREQLSAAERGKRRRKPPSNWWTVNGLSEDVESISSQPQQLEPKPRKDRKKQSKQSRSPGLGTPKTGNVAVSPTPLGGAPVPPLKVNPLSTPKTVKRSLATFKDIFSSESPTVVRNREAGQNNKCKVTARPVVEVSVTDCTALNKTDENILSMDDGESNSPPNQGPPQDSKCHSENTLKAFRSGPSSMIELEQYEEYEDMSLPSSRVHAVLSTADLCAPPLKPLILQPKDKANMAEWFKSLWSTTVDNSPVITPDQFDWYFYQGRAIGFQVDLECGSVCNGKILLGSYMKKPLWVDHSATTVFNLLTSSVSVTIDVSESSVYPGQSFMVPCGHAYSIQNNSAQPAVLYFTRVLAESSD
ncbi:nucleolar protein dao-5 isoform X2 [Morone saxatilis]|uniref:nucleolar protein dao-5 isoform X2 n=1 Tax=Morone saxatilis TaxID=34816 RepID=UPI0015E255D0|nr:nucleolar protein dao-5 isoform X2 [Morone saxatilis]